MQDNLTEDQKKYIEEKLEKIRTGLKGPVDSQFEEPAHIYVSEAFNVHSE